MHKIEAYTSKVPKLRTAAEMAEKTGVSEQRLVELAEAGYMPHWKIDGGAPLFDAGECKKWIDENLTTRYRGRALPTAICIAAANPALKPAELPPVLQRVPNVEDITHVLADRSGIYFLCHGDVVVYVGQSVSVVSRIYQHCASDKEFDRILFMPWPVSDLTRMEGAIIRALNPKYNQKNPNAPTSADGDIAASIGLEVVQFCMQ